MINKKLLKIYILSKFIKKIKKFLSLYYGGREKKKTRCDFRPWRFIL